MMAMVMSIVFLRWPRGRDLRPACAQTGVPGGHTLFANAHRDFAVHPATCATTWYSGQSAVFPPTRRLEEGALWLLIRIRMRPARSYIWVIAPWRTSSGAAAAVN